MENHDRLCYYGQIGRQLLCIQRDHSHRNLGQALNTPESRAPCQPETGPNVDAGPRKLSSLISTPTQPSHEANIQNRSSGQR